MMVLKSREVKMAILLNLPEDANSISSDKVYVHKIIMS